jgi:hypothetical protein
MRKPSGNDCSNDLVRVDLIAEPKLGPAKAVYQHPRAPFRTCRCADDDRVLMSYTPLLDFCLFPMAHQSGLVEPGFHA